MMIHVDAYVEDYVAQEQRHATDAYFTFIALNDDGDPMTVPELQLETAEERERYHEAAQLKRYMDR